jgi:hypothetical protein
MAQTGTRDVLTLFNDPPAPGFYWRPGLLIIRNVGHFALAEIPARFASLAAEWVPRV